LLCRRENLLGRASPKEHLRRDCLGGGRRPGTPRRRRAPDPHGDADHVRVRAPVRAPNEVALEAGDVDEVLMTGGI
jgi:hypothetical protein